MYPKPIKIASIKNLKTAWKESRDATGRGGAPGVDKVTPAMFRERLESNFIALRKQLIEGTYKFQPLKASLIQKDNGKFRVICIPSVQDRLAQRLILRRLTFPKDRLRVLTGVSFGVSKGKDQGVHAAIDKAIKQRNQYPWVLKTDISQFFDKIPRDFLKDKIKARVKSKSLIPLILGAVDCEIKPRNKTQKKLIEESGIKKGRGLRQGMPLSPLLSNLVLSDFDRKLQRRGLQVLRYADDIICFCEAEVECLEAQKYIEQELNKLELSIPSLGGGNSKTTVHSPAESVVFLGVEIYKQNEIYNKKIPKKTRERAVEKIKAHSCLTFNIENDYTLASVMKRLQDIPTGYRSAFPKCTNLDSLENLLREEAQKTKSVLLASIFGEDVMDSLSDEEKKVFGILEEVLGILDGNKPS